MATQSREFRWRQNCALGRFVAVTWKRKFWFGEASASRIAEENKIPLYRRRTYSRRLDDSPPIIQDVRETNLGGAIPLSDPKHANDLVMLYGLQAMEIPLGTCPVPDIDNVRNFRAMPLLFLQMLVSIGLLMKYFPNPWAVHLICIWLAIARVLWFFGAWMMEPEERPNDNIFTRPVRAPATSNSQLGHWY